MTSNAFETYHDVAELGLRPHNPTSDYVQQLMAEEPTAEYTLLSLKPGFYPTHPTTGEPLQHQMEELVSSAGLDVLCTAETTLSGEEVCELYRDVLPPNETDDAEFGTGWKRNLIAYMTTGKLFTYLIRGEGAFQKTHVLKNNVRRRYVQDEFTKVVANIGHVPDPEDFPISLEILMLGGLITSTSLTESQARTK